MTQTSPSFDALPEPFDVLRLLHLRAAGVEMAVGLGEHRIVEHEVLHARLGIDIDAAGPGRLDDVGPFAGGHVDDVEPAAGHLGPHDRPLDRLGLDEIRPGHRVQRRPVLLHLFRRVMPGDQFVEHAARFGVDEQHAAELLAAAPAC